jgi:hypothetical protein
MYQHANLVWCVLQLLRTLAKAADAISIGDVINGRVRRYGNWGLMPFGTLVGSVTPARYMAGTRVTYNEYEQVGPQVADGSCSKQAVPHVRGIPGQAGAEAQCDEAGACKMYH